MDIQKIRQRTEEIRQKPPEYFAAVERLKQERLAEMAIGRACTEIYLAAEKGHDSVLLRVETSKGVELIQSHFSSLGFDVSVSGKFVFEVTISWK